MAGPVNSGVRAHVRYPAPTNEEIAEVESTIGYSLPSALVELYAKRGNGGFGPDYGLLGLGSGHLTDQGDTALSLYRIFNEPDTEDPGWAWPKHLLPIIHAGCAIHYCIDLASPDNPVVKFDPNGFGPGDDWQAAFSVASSKLEPWLGGL
ncbi:SMI1/KNR4 family protein [uncultured Pseudoxanthomonas sp.]|uniref:SMI1/KNR4 family protein n=1 Tax=uncultured Pseudoxanthomonas sp. TaxID=281701 RepID=UPI00260236E2|nr:SMI1/KNR4 family protein [uncultured Pseudoxanthomonas sp.]